MNDIVDFVAAVPVRGALAGLDLGAKTIGLAMSDVEQRIASPFLTIKRVKFHQDAAALHATLERRQAVGLVLGLPLNMDGSEGARAQSTRAFKRNLAAYAAAVDWDLPPLALWDERLSTVAVTRALLAADVSRARRANLVDKMAAAYILQGFLDRLRTERRVAIGRE